MNQIRWGILATGNIAHSMAQALQDEGNADIVAVASRSQANAEVFGDKWDIPHRYGRYQDLAADPDVDIIYIATPHSHHEENIVMCLRAGKHVLCEKPLTLNAQQARRCVELARTKGLFLMEAVWTRFLPAMAQVRDWVASGAIGDVRLVQADFCFPLPYDPAHRLYNPALGGGALLDLGIYPLTLTTMLLGMPDGVSGHAQLAETGVDELDALVLTYKQGATAVLTCSMSLERPIEAFIAGSRGTIKIHEPFFRLSRLTLHLHDQEPQTVDVPYRSNGYIYEVTAVHACLRAGKTESELMPLDETVAMMALMDGLRAQWGVRYAVAGE